MFASIFPLGSGGPTTDPPESEKSGKPLSDDWLWFQRASLRVNVVTSGPSPCFLQAPQEASPWRVYKHALIESIGSPNYHQSETPQ